MSTALADAHDQWHKLNGKYRTCDLDCGAGERVGEFFEADAQALIALGERGIKCGSCGMHHSNTAAVRFCFEVKYDSQIAARRDAEMAAAIEAEGECEHGLSKALCAGPGHYPADR